MEKIRLFRIKKGLTQQELANKVGITNVYLSYIETGIKRPSLLVLDNIAKALEVTVKQLF